MEYKVEIKDKEFIRKSDKKQFKKTVIVTFFNKEGKETEKEEYGLIDRNEIYKWIDEGVEINLVQCYIKNFSLKEYRKKYDKEFIKKDKETYFLISTLKKFFANNSFFDCDDRIDFSRGKFEGREVTFFRCCFGCGDVTFFLSSFIDVDLNFQGSKFFVRNLTFHGCRFGNKRINFAKTNFYNSNISFDGAKFQNSTLTFMKSYFYNSKVECSNLTFKNIVNFEDANFNNTSVLFEKSDFKDCCLNFRKVNFKSDEKSKEINFTGAKFYKNLLFNKSIINGIIKFNECQFDYYANLRFAYCKSVEFKYSLIRDVLDLRPDLNLDLLMNSSIYRGIEKINILGLQNLGRISIDWKTNNVKELIENQGNETTHREKSEQFRTLKENFHKIGQYDDEDKAYVQFRKHEMKAELEDNKVNIGFKKFWNKIIINFKIFVMEKIGLYGTSPIKVMKSMGWTLLLFSIIYLLPFFKFNQIKVFSNNTILNKVLTSVYHSIVTFLTIGYGDINPANFATVIFSGIEGFIGLFLMAYFTVAFVRKVLR